MKEKLPEELRNKLNKWFIQLNMSKDLRKEVSRDIDDVLKNDKELDKPHPLQIQAVINEDNELEI